MSLATLTGLAGQSLLLTAIVLKLLLLLKIPLKAAYSMAALVFIMTFIPIDGYSINLYLRGLFNDLSITTLCLLALFIYAPGQRHKDRHSLYIIIVIAGILLYPLALGYSPVDPYAWGYINRSHGLLAPLGFITVLLLLAGYAYIRQNSLLLLCILSAVLAYQLNILESRNLWDYLLDPLVWLYALLQLPVIFYRKNR